MKDVQMHHDKTHFLSLLSDLKLELKLFYSFQIQTFRYSKVTWPLKYLQMNSWLCKLLTVLGAKIINRNNCD